MLCSITVVLFVGVVVGTLLSPFTTRRRLLRLSLFGLAYAAMEAQVLLRTGTLWVLRGMRRHSSPASREERWRCDHQRLLVEALAAVLAAARRCFGFQYQVDDRAAAQLLKDDRPLLVLARHGGPGDSFTLVHLLASTYGRVVRIVLTELLQLDPALDVLLNRLGCCFVRRRATTDERVAQLQALACRAGTGDAVLLFPEGANWTPRRRHRAIVRLRHRRDHVSARAAQLMEHVLPPRTRGVFTVLAQRPDLGVAVVAHTGLDHVVGVADAWRAIPAVSDTPMLIKVWAAPPPPATKDGRQAWLRTEWAIVDEWIDARQQGAAGTPQPVGEDPDGVAVLPPANASLEG